MFNIGIESYGKYKSSNYGKHTQCVLISRDGVCLIRVYLSYRTVVAFKVPGSTLKITKNQWGPTTGKHLNWIEEAEGGSKKNRLDYEAFQAAFDDAMMALGLTGELEIATKD